MTRESCWPSPRPAAGVKPGFCRRRRCSQVRMRRVYGLDELGDPPARSVVTIGKFFAIHRGHQALMRATVEAARRRDAAAVVLTFDRHPAEILKPGAQMPI